MWSAFTGTEQPPLPLQEFLPAQPASPALQPPIPLQSFRVLQSCLAAVAQPPLPLHAFLPSAPWALHSFMPLQTCLAAGALASAFLASAFFASSASALLPASMAAATTPMPFVNSLRSIQSLLSLLPSSAVRTPGTVPAPLRECPYAPFAVRC